VIPEKLHMQKNKIRSRSLIIYKYQLKMNSRRYTNGQQVYEQMLNITNHQGIASQNLSKMTPQLE
jgi:hypothetical protein